MARTREFDPDDVLEAAVDVFWARGFAETSMRDIVEASGVAHAGIYAEFGGKRELYKRVLEKYNVRFGQIALGRLEQPNSDVEDVRAFFEMVSSGIENGRLKNGCLMGNTVVEFGEGAGDIVDMSRQFMERMEKALKRALIRGKKKDQLTHDQSPGHLAFYLTTGFYGVMTMVRAKVDPVRIRGVIKTIVKAVA